MTMIYGGFGGFSEGMNGTNIINALWEYVDINSASLTGFPIADDASYDVPETEVETALTGLTWAPASGVVRPANTNIVGVIDETGTLDTSATHYIVPDGLTARVFRIDVNDIPAPVPEPTTGVLLALAGLALGARRKRS